MTKKSAARQARDEAEKNLKENQCWDQLNQIYEGAKRLLAQHTMIHTLGREKNLIACLRDPSDTANSIRILANDLGNMNNRLKAIHDKHASKTGSGESPDEVLVSIGIAQEYSDLMEAHTSVIQPIAMKILEDFDYSEKRLASLANVSEEVQSQKVIETDQSKLDISDAVIVTETKA